MIKHTLQIFLIAITSIILLSFSYNNRDFQTECVKIENDGYITIKIWNPKKGSKYKSVHARKNAIYAILFSGVSGGKACSTQLPILNKPEFIDNFKRIEKNFFSKKGKWSSFTRSANSETTLSDNIEDKKCKIYEVSISKNELRKYLEEQKIIKSLTNSF